jgi:hypothetical protein
MTEVPVQTIEEMKRRFPEAIEEIIDMGDVIEGKAIPPSKLHKHIFSFHDGMRLIVSRDLFRGVVYLHASASGDDHYVETIKDEGIPGIAEDTILRLSALLGHPPDGEMHAFVSNGVLHILYKQDDEDGPGKMD